MGDKQQNFEITLEVPAHDGLDAEQLGLMFALKEDGTRLYKRFPAPVLPGEVNTIGARLASAPLDQEVPLAQEDWRKGMGERIEGNLQKYKHTEKGDASWKGQFIPGPLVRETGGAVLDGLAVAFETFNDTLVLAAGQKVYKMAGTTPVEIWAGVGVDITAMVAMDKLYVFLGDGNFYYSSSDLVTFTVATDSDFKSTLAHLQQGISGAGTTVLYRSKNSNEVSYNDDPSNNSNACSSADAIAKD